MAFRWHFRWLLNIKWDSGRWTSYMHISMYVAKILARSCVIYAWISSALLSKVASNKAITTLYLAATNCIPTFIPTYYLSTYIYVPHGHTAPHSIMYEHRYIRYVSCIYLHIPIYMYLSTYAVSGLQENQIKTTYLTCEAVIYLEVFELHWKPSTSMVSLHFLQMSRLTTCSPHACVKWGR